MLALGLVLNTVGIGLFCWLIFTLAVYALPFFVAINAGIWAFHSGADVLGTPLVAVAAGGMSLAIAQIAFAMTRSLILRAIIAAVFALPATFAGYHVVLAMAQIGVPSLVWRRSSLASVRSLSAAQRGRDWPSSRSPDRSNRAGRLATVLSQFSRPPRERDDLFTLVVEQVRANRREGCSGLDRKNAIVFPEVLRPGGVYLSPAPHRRARTLLLAVALGNDSAISRIVFLFLRPTVQTSCAA